MLQYLQYLFLQQIQYLPLSPSSFFVFPSSFHFLTVFLFSFFVYSFISSFLLFRSSFPSYLWFVLCNILSFNTLFFVPSSLLVLFRSFVLSPFLPFSLFASVFISTHFSVFSFQRLLNNTRRKCWYESCWRKGIYHFLSKRFAISWTPNPRFLPVVRRYTLCQN